MSKSSSFAVFHVVHCASGTLRFLQSRADLSACFSSRLVFSQRPRTKWDGVHSCLQAQTRPRQEHWWSPQSAVTLHSALLQFHLHNPHTAECLSVIKPSWIERKPKEIHLLRPAAFSYSAPLPNLLFQLFSGQNMVGETHKRIYLH